MSQHHRITERRLLAVQLALADERAHQEIDILLDSIVVSLQSGPMTASQIEAELCNMWPGSGLTQQAVERALQTGLAARLVAKHEDATGGKQYLLVDPSPPDQGRVESILSEARASVATAFELEGTSLAAATCETYTSVLIDSLCAGIRDAFAAFSGDVDSLRAGSIVPTEWAQSAMDAVIDDAPIEQTAKEILRALLVAALDSGSKFGSDLVTGIATGYILHAFVARRDQEGNVQAVGSLGGTTIYLDTPYLVDMCGAGEKARTLLALVATLRRAHIRVLIPEHCPAELERLLDAVEGSGEVSRIEDSLRRGSDPAVLFSTIDNNLLAAWLSTVPAGGTPNWDQFRARAHRLVRQLSDLGCNRVHVPDTGEHAYTVRRFAGALEDVLIRRPRASQRGGPPNMDAVWDDGRTMTLAFKTRELMPSDRFWPGSWVMTPDSRMGEAYAQAVPDDPFPLTLLAARLTALIAAFQMPATAATLARESARLVSYQTLLRMGSRYPTDVALAIAETLRDDKDAAEVDMRLAQGSDIFTLLEGTDAGERSPELAARVVADRRARRREALARQDLSAAHQELADTTRRLDRLAQEQDLENERHRAEIAELETERAKREAALLSKMEAAESERRAAIEELRGGLEAAQRTAEEAALRVLRERTARRRQLLIIVGACILLVGAFVIVRTDLNAVGIGAMGSGALLPIAGWSAAAEDEFDWLSVARVFLVQVVASALEIWT